MHFHQILIPRPQADLNSTVLDLSSYSTMAINITSQNATLVLKLEPSEELPLVLLLGYQDYPSDSNYVAKVTFPLEANSLGKSCSNVETINLCTIETVI